MRHYLTTMATAMICAVTAMTLLLPAAASAQRGEAGSGTPSLFTNPTQGFPGFFDTNFAEQGTLVVEWPPILLPFIPMPSIAVDYGVTDTLTVGTNALVSTLPWLLGAKGISLKARGLVYGTESTQSAATVYASYIGSNEFSTSWQIFTSNNAWKIAPRHIVSANALFMNFGLEMGKESEIEYTNLRFSTLSLGGGYQFLFTETAALSAYALVPALTSIEADTVAANLNMNIDPTSGELMWGIGRASLDIRSDEWVYSLGGIYFHGLASGISPWLSATTRW